MIFLGAKSIDILY